MATLNSFFKNLYQEIASIPLFKNRYMKARGVFLFLLLGSAISYFGYSWYKLQKNQDAQNFLSSCLDDYRSVIEGRQSSWPSLQMNAEIGYEKNKGTDLAVYFKALQADAMIQHGNIKDLPPVLDQLEKEIVKGSLLYYVYRLKLALMMIDSQNDDLMQKGIVLLQALSLDEKNPNRDMALYHKGQYYWDKNALSDAKIAWQELVEEYSDSIFAKKVQSNLVHLQI